MRWWGEYRAKRTINEDFLADVEAYDHADGLLWPLLATSPAIWAPFCRRERPDSYDPDPDPAALYVNGDGLVGAIARFGEVSHVHERWWSYWDPYFDGLYTSSLDLFPGIMRRRTFDPDDIRERRW